MNPNRQLVGMAFVFLVCSPASFSQSFQFNSVQPITNREVLLKLSAPAGGFYRLEASSNLLRWENWVTFAGTSAGLSQTDSATPYLPQRFYRGTVLAATNAFTGDHLVTDDGDVVIHPLNHATFVMSWKGYWIYNDPVGGASRFTGIPKADLILISHVHGDHFDATTLSAVKGTNTVIFAPQAVYNSLSATLRTNTIVLTNGASATWNGARIDAIGMYNTTADRLSNHPKGQGNGYVLTVGNRRLYMSGDTEDIPEMRALKNIDAAFICMNLPFTMTVQQAASAVREFRPKVIYPYHFQGSDINTFKRLVGTDAGVEVRLRKWY